MLNVLLFNYYDHCSAFYYYVCAVMPYDVILSVVLFNCYAQCSATLLYTECHNAECLAIYTIMILGLFMDICL